MPFKKGQSGNDAKKFKKGQSGNPAGRPPNFGLSVQEWINNMQDWTDEQVKAVIDDPQIGRSQKVAAHRVISNDGYDFDRLMDRTIGKAAQNNHHHITGKIGIVRVQRGERTFTPKK